MAKADFRHAKGERGEAYLGVCKHLETEHNDKAVEKDNFNYYIY